LGLVWNSLKPTDTRFGVPAPFLIRKAMQQKSLSEAVGVVINAYRANGLNYILGRSSTAYSGQKTGIGS